MKLLLIDNYDSFTYNLYHRLQPFVGSIDVYRNDQFDARRTKQYDAVVFSPGPGLPHDAGCMPQIIAQCHHEVPMLGICLGMQAMGQHFGAQLSNLPKVLHGVSYNGWVMDKDDPLYQGIPRSFACGHYHSWIVTELPDCLQVTAQHEDGWALSFRHKELPIWGVQYHPESVLTPLGEQILKNWVDALLPAPTR
ncbi:MAG: aminodeoxychorismate/anthranilate synthase component II [Cryomorphaceae bacterium]|nr:MAG: aminodeoxychorismate/anthranilate synthase component II [Cryomorphaceae bacterium]